LCTDPFVRGHELGRGVGQRGGRAAADPAGAGQAHAQGVLAEGCRRRSPEGRYSRGVNEWTVMARNIGLPNNNISINIGVPILQKKKYILIRHHFYLYMYLYIYICFLPLDFSACCVVYCNV
jgi:hypothetical protein